MKEKKYKKKTFCVYDERKKGLPIVIDGTADVCAKLMGIDKKTFFSLRSRPNKRWTIIQSENIDEPL